MSASIEIIETYWNVNKGPSISGSDVLTEIIETYWNVNVWTFLISIPFEQK